MLRPQTPYSDGPPCIELMAQNKVGEGGRNNALFHYGVYAKNKWPDNWKSKVVVFNETAMDKPLSDTEVDIITKQHDKKNGATNVRMNQCVVFVTRHCVEVESLE